MLDLKVLTSVQQFSHAVQNALAKNEAGSTEELNQLIDSLTSEVEQTIEALDRPGETPIGEDPFDYYTGLINGLTADIAALRQSDVVSGERVDRLESSVAALSITLTEDIDARMQAFDTSLTAFRQNFVKQTGPLDSTPGALMTTGAGGIGGMLELRTHIVATGTPADVYGLGTIFGFCDAATIGLLGFPPSTYGELKVSSQWIDRSGRGSTNRTFTSFGRTFVQSALNDTTWGPWREQYSQDNILGVVGYANGMPTGALIEHGSNANGEYVRFADGTQICTHQVLFPTHAYNTGASIDWSFPAVFVEEPRVYHSSVFSVGNGTQNSVGILNSNGLYTTTTNAGTILQSHAYLAALPWPVKQNVQAIGRWR